MLFLLSCLHNTPTEPLPTAYHAEMEKRAQELVSDPLRGGPAFLPDASPLPPFLGVDRGIARYVGTQVCVGCHTVEGRIWSQSAHATALQTLEKEQAAYNPSCFRCHVTGFGHPGGFQREAGLSAVGCEACHGPGSVHIRAPSPGFGKLPKDGSACVACHSHDQSPDFRWETYWPLVAH